MNPETRIGISPAQMGAVFPFHLACDAALSVLQLGSGLRKLLPELLPGEPLAEHFELVTPRLPLDAASLLQRPRGLVVLRSRKRDLRLKGQLLSLPEAADAPLLFVLTPVVDSLRAVADLGLQIGDFAAHDGTRDLLLLLQAQSTTLKELHKLAGSYAGELETRRKVESELREAVALAEAANRAKAGFLATMSHEMRTPLNAVLGLLGLLQDETLRPRQRELVGTAREAGETLLDLISDILDLSKMGAGKLQLENSAWEPAGLLQSVHRLLQPKAVEKGLALRLALPERLPGAVLGDPGRLRQVLLNLAGNAVKYTERGSVVIGLEVTPGDGRGQRLRFSVVDTGIGIAGERQAEVFTEFTMLDASYARRYGGTGLGLAISRQLVELMGGRIGVDSELGQGSRFWFEVELPETEQPVSRSALDLPLLPALRPARLLLAEDVAANRLVARELLQRVGHHVDTVADGAEALQAVTGYPYDLVLMDVSMPGMDGLQATRAIRELDGPVARIPIVAMTAHAMCGDREAFLAAGMDDYLQKPVDRVELLATVARWCAEHPRGEACQPDATTAAAASSAEIDQRTLEQLARDTDPALVPELVALFLDDARGRVARIRQALAATDLARVEDEAHALGSSAGTYGLPGIQRAARHCEEALRGGDRAAGIAAAQRLVELADPAFSALAARVVPVSAA
ncbi:MAG TPA: ATP-binding protein [Gammaproteobacteria bacterium]